MTISVREIGSRLDEILTIKDIVQQYIPLRKKGAHYEGLCPFHTDQSLGSFLVTPQKNIFTCFACHVNGGPIKFYELYHDLTSYREATIQLGLEKGIIDHETYLELMGQVPPQKKETSTKSKKKAPHTPTREKASAEVLNLVYRAFVRTSGPMTKGLKDYLKKTRHVKEEHLNHFFSFPQYTVDFWHRFCEELKLEGLTTSVIETVPGFYFCKELNQIRFKGSSRTYGILLHDIDGRIAGIQIGRLDHWNKGKTVKKNGPPRYYFFSTGWAEEENKKVKLGTSLGSPVDYISPSPLPGAKKRNILAITEGKYKALALAYTGFHALSMQGVTNWKKVSEAVDQLTGSLLCRPPVYLFYDAELLTNDGVAKSGLSLGEDLIRKGYKIRYMHWNASFGKGYDDLFYSGNLVQIQKYRPDDFMPLLKTFIEESHEEMKQKKTVQRNKKRIEEIDMRSHNTTEKNKRYTLAKVYRTPNCDEDEVYVGPYCGNLVFDPELKKGKTTNYVRARIGVSGNPYVQIAKETGTYNEKTEYKETNFVEVTVFGYDAENLVKEARKGDLIVVSGKMRVKRNENQGKTYENVVITANSCAVIPKDKSTGRNAKKVARGVTRVFNNKGELIAKPFTPALEGEVFKVGALMKGSTEYIQVTLKSPDSAALAYALSTGTYKKEDSYDPSGYIQVTFFRENAKHAEKMLSDGAVIQVFGEMNCRKDNDKTYYNMVGDGFILIKHGTGKAKSTPTGAPSADTPVADMPGLSDLDDDDDEDIPF